MHVTSQLKDTMNNLTATTLRFTAEAILSLPLALVVMVAGLLLFAPDALKGDPSTWTQTLAQYHALHMPFGTALYFTVEFLQRLFLGAWLVALLSRLVVRYLPDPANYAVDKAHGGRDASERLADTSRKPQTGHISAESR